MIDLMVESAPVLSETDQVVSGFEALACSDCDSLAVVDGEGTFVGMFGVGEGIRAAFPGYLWELTGPELLDRGCDTRLLDKGQMPCPIAEFVDRRRIHVTADSSFASLACLFTRHQVSTVAVLDGGTPSGVVTHRSMLERVLIPNANERKNR